MNYNRMVDLFPEAAEDIFAVMFLFCVFKSGAFFFEVFVFVVCVISFYVKLYMVDNA